MKAYIVSHLRNSINVLGQIWDNRWQAMLTIITLGIILAIPASVLSCSYKFKHVVQDLAKAAQITVFFTKDATANRIESLTQTVIKEDIVKTAKIVKPEQGLEELGKWLQEPKVLVEIEPQALPTQMWIYLHMDKVEQKMLMQALLLKLKREIIVDNVSADVAWLEKLGSLYYLGYTLNIIIMVTFSAAVMLLIGNTTRLIIENKKQDIMVVQLLGADNGFIYREFVYYGFWYGLLGAFFALAFLLLIEQAIKTPLQLIVANFGYMISANLASSFKFNCGLFGASVGLGVLAAIGAVFSCLKKINFTRG